MALALLQQLGGSEDDATQLASEGAGQPLFIDALVRYGEHGKAAPTSLDHVLWRRTRALDAVAQRILERVVRSNGSLVQEAVARAAELDFSQLTRQIGALRAAHFVRSSGVRALDTVAPFHDRVRSAIRKNLEPQIT